MFTYEGSYEINALVCSRELTGVSAFKAKWEKNINNYLN